MPKQNVPDKFHGRPKGKYDDSTPESMNTDDTDTGGKVYSKNLMESKAEEEVRENEDASLQDDTYAFDEDNTGNDDYHDAAEIEDDGIDDYIQ